MSGYLPSHSQLVTGAGSATTTAATILIAQPSGGAICVSSLQLGRTDAGASALVVTLNDTANTALVLPPQADGGRIRDIVFDAPLLVLPQTALTFQASAGVTTLFASAQGFLKN